MEKLLLVDDEAKAVRALLKVVDWASLGIGEIETAYDGRAALEIAEKFRPDLVISDISMPKMDGIRLSEELAVKMPSCRIIFITGYCEVDYLKKAFKNGVVDYILKPIDCDELVASVKKTLAAIRTERGNEAKRRDLEDKLEKSLPLLRNGFFNQLTDGKLTRDRELKERLEELRIPFDIDGRYAVLCLRPEYEEDAAPEERLPPALMEVAMVNICDELSAEPFQGACFKKSEDVYALLVRLSEDGETPEEELGDLAERLRASISRSLSVCLTVGVGEWVDSLRQIPLSFGRALAALRQGYYLGKNQIIYLDKTASETLPETLVSSNDISCFSDLVRSGNRAGSLAELNRIFEILESYRGQDAMLAVSISLQLFTALNQILFDTRLSTREDLEEYAELTGRMIRLGSLEETRQLIAGRCLLIIDRLEAARRQESRTVRLLKEYIQQHYTEPLTIDMLAKQVYLSPAYICLLFKQETGSTINRYLTDLRLNAAQRMLADPDRRLLDICIEVGYSDPKYFSRLFKRREGLTPSEYRARLTGQAGALDREETL